MEFKPNKTRKIKFEKLDEAEITPDSSPENIKRCLDVLYDVDSIFIKGKNGEYVELYDLDKNDVDYAHVFAFIEAEKMNFLEFIKAK